MPQSSDSSNRRPRAAEDAFLKNLGFATRVRDIRRQAGVEDMPTSPLKGFLPDEQVPGTPERAEVLAAFDLDLLAPPQQTASGLKAARLARGAR